MATSKRTYPNKNLPGLLLPVPLSLWQDTADPCLHRRPSNTHRQSGSVSVRLLILFPGSRFCLCPPRVEYLFPLSCGSSVVRSHWPRIPWGFPVPLQDPQAEKPDVGSRIFIKVWEIICFYCSPVCESPTWQVCDLIWLWLHPSYCLVVASSLSLDMGYFFFFFGGGGFQHPLVKSCSTPSFNFGVLAGEDEHTSLYSAILNQSLISVYIIVSNSSLRTSIKYYCYLISKLSKKEWSVTLLFEFFEVEEISGWFYSNSVNILEFHKNNWDQEIQCFDSCSFYFMVSKLIFLK